MDGPKGSAVLGLPVPDELAADILAGVPADSLRELKLVSRAWRDFISDPFHRKRLPQTLEGFFHSSGGGEDNYGRFTGLFRSSMPEVDLSLSFLTKLPRVERMALIDSSNGLLLFAYARSPGVFRYIVCNPATKELVVVPSPSGSPPPAHLLLLLGDHDVVVERHSFTFLMFDPAVSSHFRLVELWQGPNMEAEEVEGMQVYNSETRAWRDRSSEWKRGEEGGEWEQWGQAIINIRSGRALVDGMLHFLVFHVLRKEALIVAVDGEGKTCRTIRWHEKNEDSNVTYIGESQGRLHCVSVKMQFQHIYPHRYVTKLSLWFLEDYGTQEWTLKRSVSCSEVFGERCSMFDFMVVAIHPDRNVVFVVQDCNNRKLVSYDMDSGEPRALGTLGMDCWSITPYVPCFMKSAAVANR